MKPRETYIANRKAPVSPQAIALLEVLAFSHRPMSARQLAKELQVLPSAAHRCLASLERLGLIEHGTVFPDKKQTAYYRCLPMPQAKRFYLSNMIKEFDAWFGDIIFNSYANRLYRDGID